MAPAEKPGSMLRVLQSKAETRAFYDKISGVYDPLAEHSEGPVAVEVYEWSHRHFPNLLDCRPIFVRRALEDAGFSIQQASLASIWVPVEIVIAAKV